jgi:hypothetical protein
MTFDFIDDMTETTPAKKPPAPSKLSTVVSVPNAQAKAAKKKPGK